VGELALHLGPGGPVVGQPGGVALAGTGGGEGGLVGMDGDDSAPTLLVQAWRRGHTLQATPNRARPPPRLAGVMATVTRAGQ
jgi:hypothetical protein